MSWVQQLTTSATGWAILVAAALVHVVAVARFTRLWIYDQYPPVVWLRDRFLGWTDQTRPAKRTGAALIGGAMPRDLTWRHGWRKLAKCPWCVSPWFTLVSLVWAVLSHLDAWWWLAHLWFALAYVAPMIVVRDEPDGYEDDD